MLPALTDYPLVFGFALGLSLAMPPGPILAYAAERGIRGGFWPAATVGFGATTADGVLCLLMALGLVRLVAGNATALAALGTVGGLLMLWFAYGAWRAARRERQKTGGGLPEVSGKAVRRGGAFAAGFLLAVTSPYNFAWWAGAGPSLFNDFGPTVFVGFFAAILAWVVVFATLVVWARTRVKGALVVVSYASAVMLAGFGAWLVWRGASGFVA